jgi:hypothetical protein
MSGMLYPTISSHETGVLKAISSLYFRSPYTPKRSIVDVVGQVTPHSDFYNLIPTWRCAQNRPQLRIPDPRQRSVTCSPTGRQ